MNSTSLPMLNSHCSLKNSGVVQFTVLSSVGATRAACDSEMAASKLQIGQSGVVIAPEIYFAIGISGTIAALRVSLD